MNIYAKRGHKVIFLFPTNGYSYDQEQCKKFLHVGNTYTIENTKVDHFRTTIELQEVEGQKFNSVMFTDYYEDNGVNVEA